MPGLNAFGTELLRGDGAATEVFTAIANVTNIQGPEISRETIDVTAHNSADAWMEFVGGLKDAGEISVDVNYDPSEHDTLIADFEDDDPRNYKLKFPVSPAVVWSVKAILTEFSAEAPYDDKLAASLTFKVSGKPTIGTV
ncbi:phage tail tube protein [Actinomadura fulvescens]|uniref:Phage tail tube protein n=1 Tax=Actinomadura fulvescens TaxID=46160 RepID=A0ABN3Q1K1_9ACTN